MVRSLLLRARMASFYLKVLPFASTVSHPLLQQSGVQYKARAAWDGYRVTGVLASGTEFLTITTLTISY
jgi:hypothetical protein